MSLWGVFSGAVATALMIHTQFFSYRDVIVRYDIRNWILQVQGVVILVFSYFTSN